MVKKEQKTEKKKPGIYKRLLKWIGLTFLAVLIILALFFQASWKIITLLLIILAACTVLPKPARKWFWFSVAAIVLVLIIWVFLPEDSEGWRPYTFDEELAALQAKYAIPDSENAATIYNVLLEDYDPNMLRTNFLDPNIEDLTLREPWSSQDHPELAKWIEDQQNTITKLFEASKIARCAFPMPHDTFSLSDTMDYLPEIRGWAFLLVRAGNNDMAEGRIEEGLEKYCCVGKMGDHIRQQSSLIEMMVGFAVEALALRGFRAFTVNCDATEQHLDTIEQAVSDVKHNWNSDLTRILEHEKLMAKNLLCSMAYEVNSEGRTRFSRDPQAVMRTELQEELIPLTYERRKLIKAGTILGWFGMPSTPQKAGEIIDSIYEQFNSMVEPDFDWQKEPKEFSRSSIKFNFGFLAKLIVGLSKVSYYRIHDLYLLAGAQQRGTLLIVALRRYKNENDRWPDKLDDIKSLAPSEIFVDPINGNSFVYKLTEENFTLYSKGKNNIDEDGLRRVTVDPNESKRPKIEEDDIIIWLKSSRKSKKEKADTQQSNTQKDVVK